MNTTQPNAFAQAKQGNPGAIAALVQKQLGEKGIQVRVSRNGPAGAFEQKQAALKNIDS